MSQFVAILLTHQKNSLINQLVCPDVYFNPTLDVNQDWFISVEEINNSVYEEHEWVKDLPLTKYAGPYVPPQPTAIPSGDTINFL